MRTDSRGKDASTKGGTCCRSEATATTEQLGRSSLGATRPSTRSPRWVLVSDDRTRRRSCFAAVTAQAREEQRLHQKHKALPDMKDRSISYDMSCVEKCPLTTRHVATRTLRGQLREESHDCQVRRDCSLEAERKVNTKHDRIHTQALGESGPKMDGDASVTNQTELWRQRPLYT